jgi:hypothetical protein
MGIRGPQPQEGALRRTGWRPPYVNFQYQDLVLEIAKREGKSPRLIIEAAILAMATPDEIERAYFRTKSED